MLFSSNQVTAHYLSLKPFSDCDTANERDKFVVSVLDALMACDYRGRFVATRLLLENGDLLTPVWRSVLTNWARSSVYDVESVEATLLGILALNPQDVATYQILHMLYFLSGRRQNFISIAKPELLVKVTDNTLAGYYDGIVAFELSENGQQDNAQSKAEAALRQNTDDIYALHAGIHALQYQGLHHDAADWMRRDEFWAANTGMNMHLCWHLALAELVSGELDKSLVTFARLQAMKPDVNSDHDLDLANYLWRLACLHPEQLSQFDEILNQVADSWTNAIGGSMSYFNHVHAVLTFVLAKRVDLIEKLIFMRESDVSPSSIESSGIDLLKGLHAFAIEDYTESAEKLLTTKKMWVRIGGSWAQREILDYALLVALRRANREKEAVDLCAKSPAFLNNPLASNIY